MGFSVQVRDAWTGEPLQNVPVTVGKFTGISDSAGKVTLDATQLEPPLLISTGQAGYRPWQMTLMRLPQDSTELPLVINLEPHQLTGTIIDAETGLPLPGVSLTAGETRLTADENGVFTVSGLLPGEQLAFLPDERFLPASVIFSGEDTLTVQIIPRQLNITVLDSFSGLPISGATVQASEHQSTTGIDGVAALTHVSPQGSLQISHPAYLTQTLLYENASQAQISLNPNQIQGTVRDALTGEPVPDAKLRVDGLPLRLTDEAGFYLPNLNRQLNLSLQHLDYRTATLKVSANADNLVAQPEHLQLQPCQNPADATSPCFDLLLQPFTAKAIYIPFTLLSQPETVTSLLDLVSRTELNAVILDVKSDLGSLAWDSQVPQADLLEIDGNREGWMTLATFIEEAHQRDIYTIARMVMLKDNPLAFGVPELAVLQADGSIWIDGEGLAWANPFREEVWDYNIALAEEVAEIGFDEINLDYIRFPSDGNLSAITYAEENTAETRTTAIRTFISRMDAALEPYGVYLSADVFGLTVWVEPESDMNIGQRVIDIAPSVDFLSPMIYPSTFAAGNLGMNDPSAYPYEVISRSTTSAIERVPPTARVRPWLQGYWYDTTEMWLQKQAANEAGSSGWLWWNAAGVYDEAVFDPAP